MGQASEKISKMDEYKRERKGGDEQMTEQILEKSRRDFGKVAIFVSVLTVMLLVVFFFALQQNLTGLNSEVARLSGLQGEVATLGETVAVHDEKIVALEKLPEQTRNMIIGNAIAEMGSTIDNVGGQVPADQADKLTRAKALLMEVRQGLNQ